MVERTIEKEDAGKGDLTPAARCELDELNEYTKASSTLGEKSLGPVRIKVYLEMKVPMEMLVVTLKKEPTVNICRSYAMQEANERLSEGHFRDSLRILVFFQLDEEPAYNIGDPFV